MNQRSPLDYDISVSADKQRRTRTRGQSGAFESSRRGCDCPGCGDAGVYRAPRAPNELDSYYWFCLEHVRDYNRQWNFFQDSTAEDLERQVEADRLWGRPTWAFAGRNGTAKPVSDHTEGRAWARFGFDDPMQVLGDNATINPGAARGQAEQPRRRILPKHERRALDVLGANDIMTKAEMRRLYKDLVKSLHPDMNGGSRAEEDRLREVFWAWEQIRASTNFRD